MGYVAIAYRMWTGEEEAALRLYCGPAHRSINDFLRGIEDLDASLKGVIPAIDRVIAQNVVSEDFVTYRGVNADAAAYIRRMKLEKGDQFEEDGYVSTSLDPGPARLFAAWPAGGFLLKVHVKSGTNGLHMSAFSEYPEEQEFLLPRGTVFRVIAPETSSGILEVEVGNG